MKSNSATRTLAIAVGLVAVVGVLVFVVWQKGLASAETAAWVQAVGTIGAIFGAIWIAQASERRATADQKQRRADAIQTLASVAEHASQTIADAAERYAEARTNPFGTRRAFSASIASMQDAAAALESVSLEAIPPHSGLVTSVMTLRRMLLEASGALTATDMEPDAGLGLGVLAERAETCVGGITAAARALRDVSLKRNAD
jgi:hypothetical protein